MSRLECYLILISGGRWLAEWRWEIKRVVDVLTKTAEDGGRGEVAVF